MHSNALRKSQKRSITNLTKWRPIELKVGVQLSPDVLTPTGKVRVSRLNPFSLQEAPKSQNYVLYSSSGGSRESIKDPRWTGTTPKHSVGSRASRPTGKNPKNQFLKFLAKNIQSALRALKTCVQEDGTMQAPMQKTPTRCDSSFVYNKAPKVCASALLAHRTSYRVQTRRARELRQPPCNSWQTPKSDEHSYVNVTKSWMFKQFFAKL